MELTGDPLHDYLEELVDAGKNINVKLDFPRRIIPLEGENACPDDVLRALIKNTQAAISAGGGKVPMSAGPIKRFLAGGPRPEITG